LIAAGVTLNVPRAVEVTFAIVRSVVKVMACICAAIFGEEPASTTSVLSLNGL
jgi:hypothetical protein